MLWTSHPEEHFTARVTGAPTLHDGRLYVPVSSWEEFSARTLDYPCCTFRGSVAALDAATGRQIWKTYVIPEEPKPVRRNSKGPLGVSGVRERSLSGRLRGRKQNGELSRRAGPDLDIPASPLLATLSNGRQILVVGSNFRLLIM